MKKILYFVLLSLIIAGCQQQKEEPKSKPQFPSGPILAQDTLRLAQEAVRADPKNVDVRVDMGTCYRNSGKPDLAVKEFRKALEINPNHAFGHLNLAIVLAGDFKDKAQAIKEFEKYLQVAPNAQNAEQIRQEIQKLKTSK